MVNKKIFSSKGDLLQLIPVIYTTVIWIIFSFLGISYESNPFTILIYFLTLGIASLAFNLIGFILSIKNFLYVSKIDNNKSTLIEREKQQYKLLFSSTFILGFINSFVLVAIGFQWLSPLLFPQVYMILTILKYFKARKIENILLITSKL